MNLIAVKDEKALPSLQAPVGEVKMFIQKDPLQTEIAVNQWLKHNRVKVTHMSQSQSEKGGNFFFVLSIFYIAQQDNC